MGRHGDGSWDWVVRGTKRYARFRITVAGKTVTRVGISKSRVEKEAAKLRQRARARLIGDDEEITVEAWAIHRWLPAKENELGEAGAKTVRNYRSALEKHVIPAIGDVRVRDVRAQHRRNLQAKMKRAGLKVSTINVIDGVLKACLQAAADEELPVVASVLTAVRPLKATASKAPRFTAENALTLLKATRASLWWPMWVCYACTGCRDSEVRALRWEDLEDDLLTVQRQLPQQPGDPPRWQDWLKGRKTGRQIPVIPLLAQALREHKVRQNEARLKLGAGMWCDHDLIFPDEVGRALGSQRVNYQFEAACKDAGLPTWKGLGVHAMRHAANNLLRELGVDAPLRAQILGHTRAVNESVYTADDLALARQAMAKMAGALAI